MSLTFFCLPLEIRQRIYDVNINAKLKKLADRQHYLKIMVIYELKGIKMEQEMMRLFALSIKSYIKYSNRKFYPMVETRFKYARQLTSQWLNIWLNKLDNEVYTDLFQDLNFTECYLEDKAQKWKYDNGYDSEIDIGITSDEEESDSDSD